MIEVFVVHLSIVRQSKFQLKKVALTLMKQLVRQNLNVHGNNNIVHIYPRDFVLWGIFYEVNNAKRYYLRSKKRKAIFFDFLFLTKEKI